MYRLVSALLTLADLALMRRRAHPPRICSTCGRTWARLTTRQHYLIEQRRLPGCRRRSCDGVLYPVWEPGPEQERLLRDALAATPHPMSLMKNGAPGWTPGTPPNQAAPLGGTTAMTTIIQRRARDLHAGDVITHDPDHNRPVRWRVSRPPVAAGGGEYALAHYWDLKSGAEGIAYYKALVELSVEPVGGAQ